MATSSTTAKSNGVRQVSVSAQPYANLYGTISVPKNIKGERKLQEYLEEHWDEIKFGEPDFDFRGCCYEVTDGSKEYEFEN